MSVASLRGGGVKYVMIGVCSAHGTLARTAQYCPEHDGGFAGTLKNKELTHNHLCFHMTEKVEH